MFGEAGNILAIPLPIAWLCARLPLVALALFLGSQADATYLHYGQSMVGGKLPYRDFAVEYPPLAMLYLAIPAFVAHAFDQLSSSGYSFCFGAQALALDALLTAFLARGAGRVTVLWYLMLSLVGGSILQTFDLLPAALAATAVLLHRQGRTRFAWLALALASASKGWPLLLVPVFIVVELERPRRLAVDLCVFALSFAALLAPSLLGGAARAVQGIAFHAQRQPEVETVYANIAMAAHDAAGVQAHVFIGGSTAVPQAHSSNVWSALPGWTEFPHVLLIMLMLAGYALVLPRLRRDAGPVAGSAAVLIALFMLGFSVLETQYLIWLTPMVALAAGVRPQSAGSHKLYKSLYARAAFCIVCFALLSHVLRFEWSGLLAMRPNAVAIAIIRNSSLVLALVYVCRYTAVRHKAAT